MKKLNRNIPVYVLLLVFCAIYFAGTFNLAPSRAKTISDAVVPRICILGLAITDCIILFNALKNNKAVREAGISEEELSAERAAAKKRTGKIVYLIAVMVIAIAAMKPLGFVISMIFFLLTTMIPGIPKEKRNYFIIIPVAVLLPLAVHLVFLNVFSILLPPGVLTFLT